MVSFARVTAAGVLCTGALAAGCWASPAVSIDGGIIDAEPIEASSSGTAVLAQKVLTLNDGDDVFTPGMVWIERGKITYVGPPREAPAGWETVEYTDGWLAPGQVDLHTHIHTGGWGDINDMVQSVNPELRSTPTFRPANALVKRACASGVTTLFGIPGSGTNIGGFGILYKAKTEAGYDEAVLADPGGMKVAQDSNPQRVAGNFMLGNSRAGMGYVLEDIQDRANAESGAVHPGLANLHKVMKGELPVLIHTAGGSGVLNSARMWKVRYETRCVISHGSFNGWKVAEAIGKLGVPVNHGPRTVDWSTSRNGRINGSAAVYSQTVPLFSLNTDSGVIPQEEFFLQGAMGARYGADPYAMLRALTIHPAKAFGIDDRVGSLEVGKDADLVVHTGDPLDPRTYVQRVWIDGAVHYDRKPGSQWF